VKPKHSGPLPHKSSGAPNVPPLVLTATLFPPFFPPLPRELVFDEDLALLEVDFARFDGPGPPLSGHAVISYREWDIFGTQQEQSLSEEIFEHNVLESLDAVPLESMRR
jgi:hypothetical protein